MFQIVFLLAIASQAIASNTIVDLALATPTLSTLVAGLKAGDLVTTLQGPGPFTVFAPTNAAFSALPAGVLANLLKPANKAALDNVLTYHVLGDEVMSAQILDNEMLRTLNSKYVTARVSGATIFINSAKVTTANIQASNGVIHIIDAVLLPSTAPPSPGPSPAPGTQNIVQLASATPSLSTLVTALGAASLVNTLEGKGPFTVFAPTNTAFQNLPKGALQSLLKPENKDKLVDILTFHVVAGTVHAKDILDGERLQTVEGMYIMAAVNSSGVFLNNAQVTTADVNASNGVVHIIDAVLEEWNPSPTGTCSIHHDTAMSADFYKNVKITQDACCSLCTGDSRCKTAVYSPRGECHLHDATDSARPFTDRGWMLMTMTGDHVGNFRGSTK